ncbi:ABC transporter ATP-binding protein [Oribacterium sp. oral taxon 108]|uniref:ABC transporter ATP-binding protein n=1 Tax=Oribacterium sp. oral taxon 108 TaxID=712414 RepID=UPI00020DC588|nr:ABC transporter, ATP-binding protein [Oribacterium sp. oral taxon 108 str. F0425]
MEKETILKVSDLSVNYGYVAAVRNVHLQVCKNEIVTLIGSNGAGKTTTLMAISNLVEKTSGQILFDNEDIGKLPPDQVVRKGIAHVPEGRKIFPRLSVYENLLVGSLGNPKLKKTEIEEQIEYIFSLFPRLKERRKQAGGSLSGGEQQMLAIGRGLMMKPELIMLDEPSMGLAPIIVEDIFELILKIRDTGKTILLIEQNASMALSIADRAYVLETGKITMEGKGSDLLNDENVKKVYLGA